MNKKIVGAIAIAIIVIGIIVTAILGINSDLIYRDHQEIDIKIGKEFEEKDIEAIVSQVIGNGKVSVSKVELFKDMATIRVENITDDQLSEMNTKINEKYEIDNKVEDITKVEVPRAKWIDLIKPYIVPVIISMLLIEAYLVIYLLVYKKTSKEVVEINIPKSMLELFLAVGGVQLVYFSLIVITRFQANRVVIPISIVLFIATAMAKFIKK